MGKWTDICDGGKLLHESGFFGPVESENLFAWLRQNIAWRQEAVHGRPLPRLNAWFSDADLTYSYFGVSHVGTGWSPKLLEIKKKVEGAAVSDFNSCC
jgi:hypothetical protein